MLKKNVIMLLVLYLLSGESFTDFFHQALNLDNKVGTKKHPCEFGLGIRYDCPNVPFNSRKLASCAKITPFSHAL